MSDDWYYMVGEEVIGPVSFKELRHAVAEAAVSADTLVRRTMPGDWVPASGIAGLFEPPVAPPPESSRLVACSECGRLVSSRAFACPQCGCPAPQADTSGRAALDGRPRRYLGLKLCGVTFAVVAVAHFFLGFILVVSLMLDLRHGLLGIAIMNLAGGVVLLALAQFCFLAVRVENNTDRLARLLCQPLRRGQSQQETDSEP